MTEYTELQDGVYFNLDEAIYHGLRRLSSSGICEMLVSPSTYWADSWMNPDNVVEDGAEEEATKAQILGRAYHVARLEPHRFASTYWSEPSKKDFPDHLQTDAQICEQLKLLHEPQKKAGETVLERAHRLKAAGYPGGIWHLEAERLEEERAGRIPLPTKFYSDIVRDMERINSAPEILQHLTGGAAEVSILWTDEKGTKKKARVDYLRPDERTDLKTFDNSRGKELETCLKEAFRYNRYYVQAAFYDEPVELIRKGNLKVIGKATDDERDLVDAIAEQPRPLPCWYVFQEKNGVPNILAREIKLWSDPHESHAMNDAGVDAETSAKVAEMTVKKTALMAKAQTEIRHAESLYRFYMEEFGDRVPWPPLTPSAAWGDDDFSPYWLDIAGA